jgi:hypothetical protein
MLEHVRQGGRPYDIRGQHIVDIVEELNVLGRFERSVARETVLEGDTAQLVSEAAEYRKSLKENLKRLGTGRGYATYFEGWNPVELSEQDVVIESLKHMFVKQTLDARIEQALPVLARIQQQGNAMKEANIFEAWAERLVEGTWSTPDTPESQQKLLELMSAELPVGADATNATEQLYNLLGDDKLFDLLESLAQQDPNADCRQIILDRMQELSDLPDVRAVLEQLNVNADATMNPPESMPADLSEGAMKDMLWKMCERMDRQEFIDYCVSEWGWDSAEMGEFWDSINGEQDIAEGSMKREMWDFAERVSLEAFLERYPDDEEFWRSINDEQDMAEDSKRFPDIRQFDKTVLDKRFGGSIVKMAQALKDAGFSRERIVQKMSDFKQGVAEDDVEDFLNAGGKITQVKSQRGPRRPGLGLASKHIGGGGDRMKPSRTGRGANTQGKPVVAAEDAVRSLRRAAGLTEGRMLDEDNSKLDHILDRFKYEVRSFEQGGDLDKDLYEALFDYYYDIGEMPYGTAKARDGDPYEWVAQNLESHLRGGGVIGGVPDEDYGLERESVGDYAPEEMRAPHSVDGGMDNAILYDDSTCNMSEAGENCPIHGLDECWAASTAPAPVAPMEEKSPLSGIYGHSGKMKEVGKDTSFLDRLKTLSGMAKS